MIIDRELNEQQKLVAFFKPKAWRVKDYADGWIECATIEEVAAHVAVMGSVLVEAVWDTPSTPPQAANPRLLGPNPDRIDEG